SPGRSPQLDRQLDPGRDARRWPRHGVGRGQAAMMDRRLIREASFDLGGKLWQVNWLYVLLLCGLAGVGYVALYSAAGGSTEPYASRHLLRFAACVGLMLAIALVDIRVLAKLSWPAYFISL